MSHSNFSTSNYIVGSGTVPTGAPLTIAYRIKPASVLGAGRKSVSVYLDASNNFMVGDDSGTPYAQTFAAGAASQGAGPSAMSAGTWYSVCGVFASATSRTCYLDGVAGTTETTSRTPSSTTAFNITKISTVRSGSYAEVALWNAALSAEDVAALLYTSPLLIRPDALLSYIPLLDSGTLDYMAVAATVTGSLTKDADHPRVIYPRRRNRVALLKVATGGSTAYTAVLDPASFAFTGSSLTVPVGRNAVLDPAAFVVTGSGLSVPVGRNADLAPASFAVTGSGLSVPAGRNVDLSPASFGVTGSDLNAGYASGLPAVNNPSGGGKRKTLPYGWWNEELEPLKEIAREAIKDVDEPGPVGETASLVESIINPFRSQAGRINWVRLAETAQNLEQLKVAVAEFKLALEEQEDEEALLMLI